MRPVVPGARRTARVQAEAKVNLFLRILSREPGGYHQLETLFQRIALADSVTVHVGGSGRTLDCRGAECIAGGDDNLFAGAAQNIRELCDAGGFA